jgi:hypothetical protein
LSRRNADVHRLPIWIAIVLAVAALFVACQKKEEPGTGEVHVRPAPDYALWEGNAVMGVEAFKNPDLGTTGKSCESCHPNGGQEGLSTPEVTTKPLIGVKDRYPGPFSMMPDEGDMTLEEVVNACLTGPVGSEPYDEDGRDMADMIAYLNGL